MTPFDARPKTIGEILDRAIATYVRRFVPLFVILGIVSIPAGVLTALSGPSFTHLFQALSQIGSLPASDTVDRARLMAQLSGSALPSGWLGFAYLFDLIFYPLAQTAVIVYAAGVLDGASPGIAAAYRTGVRRWLPQIVTIVAFFAFFVVICVCFGVVAGLCIAALAVLALLSRAVAAAALIVVLLAAFAALVVVAALGYIAWMMASISVALDDGNPVRAIGRGLRRTLDRPLLKRTLAVALAVVAIGWFGSLAIISFGVLLEYVTHLTLLYGIFAAGASVLLDGVRIVFVLLYTRDVQLRREGADLMLAAAAPAPAL